MSSALTVSSQPTPPTKLPPLPPLRVLKKREIEELTKMEEPLRIQLAKLKEFIHFGPNLKDDNSLATSEGARERFFRIKKNSKIEQIRVRVFNHSPTHQISLDDDMFAIYHCPSAGVRTKLLIAKPEGAKNPYIQFPPDNCNIVVFSLQSRVYIHCQSVEPNAPLRSFFTVFEGGTNQTYRVEIETAMKELEAEKKKQEESTAIIEAEQKRLHAGGEDMKELAAVIARAGFSDFLPDSSMAKITIQHHKGHTIRIANCTGHSFNIGPKGELVLNNQNVFKHQKGNPVLHLTKEDRVLILFNFGGKVCLYDLRKVEAPDKYFTVIDPLRGCAKLYEIEKLRASIRKFKEKKIAASSVKPLSETLKTVKYRIAVA